MDEFLKLQTVCRDLAGIIPDGSVELQVPEDFFYRVFNQCAKMQKFAGKLEYDGAGMEIYNVTIKPQE